MKRAPAKPIKLSPEAIQALEAALLPVIEKALDPRFYLLAVAFEKEAGYWYLRVYVEGRDFVISLDDCERISRALDPLIDEWPGLAELSFSLEVSSPGLFRPLSTPREFDFYAGRPVRIEARPTDAEKAQAKKQLKKQAFVAPKILHEGTLQGFDPIQNKLKLKKNTSDELFDVPLTPDVLVVLNPELRLPDDGTEAPISQS